VKAVAAALGGPDFEEGFGYQKQDFGEGFGYQKQETEGQARHAANTDSDR